MKTGNPVVDGRKRLSDDLYGKLQRKISDLVRRVDEGTLDHQTVMRQLQQVIEKNEPIIPKRKFLNEDSFVYFTVTSDGTSGEEWIRRLGKQGYGVEDDAKKILLSGKFNPTKGVVTRVKVTKGSFLGEGNATTENFSTFATNRGYKRPNLEVACLIREMFSDDEIQAMNLDCIAVYHTLVKVPALSNDTSFLGVLGIATRRYGGSMLGVIHAGGRKWDWGPKMGFAFAQWSSE